MTLHRKLSELIDGDDPEEVAAAILGTIVFSGTQYLELDQISRLSVMLLDAANFLAHLVAERVKQEEEKATDGYDAAAN